MPVGRATTISKNAVAFLGVRSLSLEYSGGSINLTSGEDSGIQLLDSVAAEESLSFSLDGIAKDQVIRDLVLGGTQRLFTDITIEFGDGDSLAVDLFLESFSEGNPYQEGVTFSATFSSSGAWTYTQAA